MIKFTKTPGKDFVILNITDTHLTGIDWTEDTGHKAICDKTITELIERVKPDLITLTGDYSTEPYFIDMVRFADYMESFGLPWAPVWGNHDNSGGAEFIDHAADVFLTKPHCIYEKGDPEMGNGNYIISIEENGKPVSALFMMDTHRGNINPAQIAWFKENNEALKADGCKDSAVLIHMPLTEFEDAFNEALIGGIEAHLNYTMEDSYKGTCWNEGYEDSFGIMREKVCPIAKNDEWFETVRNSGLTKYVIAGHEHINNFSINYKGVRLVYALKTDLDAYGRIPFNGGTEIRITSDGIGSVQHEFVDVEGMPHNP